MFLAAMTRSPEARRSGELTHPPSAAFYHQCLLMTLWNPTVRWFHQGVQCALMESNEFLASSAALQSFYLFLLWVCLFWVCLPLPDMAQSNTDCDNAALWSIISPRSRLQQCVEYVPTQSLPPYLFTSNIQLVAMNYIEVGIGQIDIADYIWV